MMMMMIITVIVIVISDAVVLTRCVLGPLLRELRVGRALAVASDLRGIRVGATLSAGTLGLAELVLEEGPPVELHEVQEAVVAGPHAPHQLLRGPGASVATRLFDGFQTGSGQTGSPRKCRNSIPHHQRSLQNVWHLWHTCRPSSSASSTSEQSTSTTSRPRCTRCCQWVPWLRTNGVKANGAAAKVMS